MKFVQCGWNTEGSVQKKSPCFKKDTNMQQPTQTRLTHNGPRETNSQEEASTSRRKRSAAEKSPKTSRQPRKKPNTQDGTRNFPLNDNPDALSHALGQLVECHVFQ